jgi:hypothetical protein
MRRSPELLRIDLVEPNDAWREVEPLGKPHFSRRSIQHDKRW